MWDEVKLKLLYFDPHTLSQRQNKSLETASPT